MINQDNSGFENMFQHRNAIMDEYKVSQKRPNGANMMLNFDYSSMFDNKEAMQNNSMMSGG